MFHEKPISKTQTIIDEFVENNDGTNVTNNSIEDDFDDINDSLNTEFETSDDEEKVEAV